MLGQGGFLAGYVFNFDRLVQTQFEDGTFDVPKNCPPPSGRKRKKGMGERKGFSRFLLR